MQDLDGIYSVQRVEIHRWTSGGAKYTVTWEPNDCDSGLDQEYEDEFQTLDAAVERARQLLVLGQRGEAGRG